MSSVPIEKYIGRRAEIIYQDSKGNFTKRRVSVYSVRNGKVRVLDWGKKSFRTLAKDRILSALPIVGRAV
ncbi:hypothetical protein GE107_09855 [Cohnella sp. CFH 77786]|uniref:hypothetical protein n=1 Tax=Cohnella sp. CFH 77786 TaxID=2662265 RepID=UPI001C60CE2A|nr:hypothetical protein [Cohnella sp. CFH 77786]MBW5446363.1 hypothetical protein [Cohnella sp. CFH 77786]